jgi:hypothetical protein
VTVDVAKSVVVSAVEPFGKKPDGVIREMRFSLSEGVARHFNGTQVRPEFEKRRG